MEKIKYEEKCTPGAIAHEDAFPYGQCAVVPHQQKVEDFISDSKHRECYCFFEK